MQKYHKFAPGTFDCSEAHHFRSKVENKLVSVKLTRDYFMMFVWKNDELTSASS
ncbi:hypothetical protein CRE_08388 [Caenorhabditis remanei]|uniref:Uncharacterized protein n=1 Tax=Caenorhabditis remanei TaxID=31234 RepID=E3MPH2_CAERE|nr:hypothetical protein CRE_08388 [Caenorhabditis remanei]